MLWLRQSPQEMHGWGMGRLLWHTSLVNTHTTPAKKRGRGAKQAGEEKGIGNGTSIPLIRLKVFR